MLVRLLGCLGALLLIALSSPAHAVRADAQQCFPDGRCLTCVEYSGGVCTKCQRNPRCGRRPPYVSNRRCRYNSRLPECKPPSQYFNQDGTVDNSDGRYRPRRRYYRY